VVATGAASFMIVLDTYIVNLALARIGTEFNSGLATWQWLVDGYALVFASLLLGAGARGPCWGRRHRAKTSAKCLADVLLGQFAT
jgi:DHA2 family methylenomycin A resistance protein-like MFS transporter